MQALGAASVIAYCAVATFVILKVLNVTLGLRVSEDEETEGLDIVSHEERGYDI